MTPISFIHYHHIKKKSKTSFNDNEEERIQDVTENIVKLLPTLIEKKIDLFSSKVNQNLIGI